VTERKRVEELRHIIVELMEAGRDMLKKEPPLGWEEVENTLDEAIARAEEYLCTTTESCTCAKLIKAPQKEDEECQSQG
jgi:sugar-specific transcriptional regulator TrmB